MIAQSKKQVEEDEKQLEQLLRKEYGEEMDEDSNDNSNTNNVTNNTNDTSTNNLDQKEPEESKAKEVKADPQIQESKPEEPKKEETKTEAAEQKSEHPILKEDQLQKMTVPQLKAELTLRGLKAKGVKADLQAQLRLYFAGKINPEESKKEDDKPQTRKRTRNQTKEETAPTKSSKGKSKPKPKKKKKGKKWDSSSEEEEIDEDLEENEEEPPVKSYDYSEKRSTGALAEELLELIENHGTKMGNLIYYLRRLWDQSPESRVIIFSQFDGVLWQVSSILNNNGIGTCFVQGNVMSKNKAINAFKANESDVRVIMLSIEKAASGTNLVEASHVVLMDPVTGTKEEAQAIEAQAIARAHRQGQTSQVTLVRFLIQDTIEHEMYVKNYLNNDESQFHGKKKELGEIHKAIAQVSNRFALKRAPTQVRPKLSKGASIGNLLANTDLRSSGAIIKLIEESADADAVISKKHEGTMMETEDQQEEVSSEQSAAQQVAISDQ